MSDTAGVPAWILPDLCDAHPDLLRAAAPGFTSYGARHTFGGPIRTIKCFEDNSLVASQLSQPGSGHVLVVDGGGSLRCALVGDNLARNGAANGWAGVIVYGCVRDVEELREMPLGIVALAAHPVRSVKQEVGQSGMVVEFHGVAFVPDQYVYVDLNGIAVAPVNLL